MPTALFSVFDKTGIVDLAQRLATAGWKILATGGTYQTLCKAGLAAQEVSDYTQQPEILAGRVKTLHPAVFAGLLARPQAGDLAVLQAAGWQAIDLLVVNLYPFEKVAASGAAYEEIIENIDIGGVALLRAAAKNFARVSVFCDPRDYPSQLEALGDLDFRKSLAGKAFAQTSAYDSAIHSFFAGETGGRAITLYGPTQLRYGENPHQSGAFYATQENGSPFGARILQGKELSYNNLLDLEAAWQANRFYAGPAVVIVKHNSPCGIAAAGTLAQALELAIASDPVSAFGGVIAANRPVDAAFVRSLGELFIECIAAPGYEPAALQELSKRKSLRLLEIPAGSAERSVEYRSIGNGFLAQTRDEILDADEAAWKVVSQRQPTEEELEALRFAWRACLPVKSNAIVLAASAEGCYFTVGIGGGQPNRVDSVRIAGERAAERARGSVLASDAFFPFPDGVVKAAELGVTAVIQPGGSLRDAEAIAAADQAGMVMIFTGKRHFKH